MYYALNLNKTKIIAYILGIDDIQKKYMSDNDALYGLVLSLNYNIHRKEAVKCVVDTLGLTEADLKELASSRPIDISKIIPFTKSASLSNAVVDNVLDSMSDGAIDNDSNESDNDVIDQMEADIAGQTVGGSVQEYLQQQ